MALQFKKIEAVDFGGVVVEPKIDIESRMRLQQIKLDTPTGVSEAITVISECFGDKGESVKEFIENNMGIVDIAKLQAYLIGGNAMLDKVEKKLEEVE